MNAGILTFHMAHNCGAMLQAYALCKCITTFFSFNCEIIDYRLPEIYQKYELLLHENPIDPKRKKFDQYMRDKLPISQRVYKLLNAKQYDVYIIGSDQIWNQEITNGYKDEYFAKCFPPNSFCISYAASSGVHINDPQSFVKRLDRFKCISVRESWLQKELSTFYNGKIAWCLDPVLLLDSNQWSISYKGKGMREFRYILIYSFEVTDKEYMMIEKWAKQHQLKIIELVTHGRTKRENIFYENDYGPEEWLVYMQNASYIYTDSYHGVLFSIIYKKHFYYIMHEGKENLRIKDIIERLNIVKNEQKFYSITESISQQLEKSRTESILFLKEAFIQVQNEKTNI